MNANGEGILDTNGSFALQTQFQLNSKAPQPRAAKLICEITDINQQTVSKSVEFVRQSSEFYFGLRRFDAVFKEGDPLPLSLIAITPDGTPLSKSIKAKVRLTRIDWQTNRLDGAGDTTAFESKPELQVVWEKELTTEPGQGTDRKPIPAPLNGLTADRAGEYLLEVLGKDDGGHDVVTSTSFNVAGKGQLTWDYRNPYVIDVSSDKDSYQPGQIATLLVKTPISGEALVTIEQDRVIRSFLTTLSGNAPSIHVPILETDAPNVFVSIMVLRGSEASPENCEHRNIESAIAS